MKGDIQEDTYFKVLGFQWPSSVYFLVCGVVNIFIRVGVFFDLGIWVIRDKFPVTLFLLMVVPLIRNFVL